MTSVTGWRRRGRVSPRVVTSGFAETAAAATLMSRPLHLIHGGASSFVAAFGGRRAAARRREDESSTSGMGRASRLGSASGVTGRSAVAQRFEACEITVEGDDLAIVFGCDSRYDGVGDEVTREVRFVAQLTEQGQVPWPGIQLQMLGLRAGGLEEPEGLGTRRRHPEDPSVRGEAQE